MTLPEPLTPADADLRDFTFMPLDVVRFAQSDLVALEDPEAIVAAIHLWGASWHSTPAGSLTDDDRSLARQAGYGRSVETFLIHKAGALRGFIKCSDGRLYHPVVAEKVVSAWDGKLKQRWKTYCSAVRKHNQRNPDDVRVSPDFNEWREDGQPATVSRTTSALRTATEFDGLRDVAGHAAVTRGEADVSRGTNTSVPRDSTPLSRVTDPDGTRDERVTSQTTFSDGVRNDEKQGASDVVDYDTLIAKTDQLQADRSETAMSRGTTGNVTRDTPPKSHAGHAAVPRVNGSKGEGEGEGYIRDSISVGAKSDFSDVGVSDPPDPPKPRSRPNRGTLLPDDWALPDDWRDWACSERNWARADATAEARLFANHWHGKSGADATKRNWRATWENWVLRSHRPAGGSRGTSDGFSIGGTRMNSPC